MFATKSCFNELEWLWKALSATLTRDSVSVGNRVDLIFNNWIFVTCAYELILLKHLHRYALQREAELLKGNNMTRVVAVGIGDDVRLSELHIMASRPHSLTVTTVPDFSNLTKADVEKDIMRAICGKHRLYISAIYSYHVRKQTQIHLICRHRL